MFSIARLQRLLALTVAGMGLLLLGGCATSSFHAAPAPSLSPSATIAVADLSNATATPYAGRRAGSLLAALLAQAPGSSVTRVPPPKAGDSALPIGEGADMLARQLQWARSKSAAYLLTGTVDEWQYKIGLDGQPAVGFTLQLLDVQSGRSVWTGAASASGSSREGLSVLAQDTLHGLVQRMTGR